MTPPGSSELPNDPDRSSRPKRARSKLTAFLLVAVAIYLGLVLVMVLFEKRLVYPGAYYPEGFGTPYAVLEDVESVTYPSTDDIRLTGRLLERRGSAALVLYFHGNGTKAVWLDDWIAHLGLTLNATVMAAELRGFEDDHTPTERGVIEDAFAARDYLCERYGIMPSDIVLYGRSLGGGLAAALAASDGAQALVLERTFDQLVRVGATKFPWLPVRLVMRNRFDSAARLADFRGPVLQIHGTADQIVPIERGRALFSSLQTQVKRFIEVPGLGHNDSIPDDVLEQLALWLAALDEA